MRHALLCSLLGLLAASSLRAQPLTTSTAESQDGVSLTVYNQNFAVVREVRPLTLRRGMNLVRFEDVAAQIDPTSLALKALSDPDAVLVQEQNYQYDLISHVTLLDKSVGERIRIRQTLPGGGVETVEGTLLSQPGQGTIIQLDDGRVLINPSGQIELAALPEGLISRPSLLWKVEATHSATYPTEVPYLTGGVHWEATYSAVIDEAEDAVDLSGWVTLTNTSGTTYRDAGLQLMAGDVRRVQEEMYFDGYERPIIQRDVIGAPRVVGPNFGEASFFEYHLYTLDGRTTIAQNETKQLALLAAGGVGVRRRLAFDPHRRTNDDGVLYSNDYRANQGGSTQESKVNVILEVANTEANQLGMPLPKGKVRLYKSDERGNLQFLGEDLIDHTPRNEDVRLYVGDAFDVVGTRTVKAERRPNPRIVERDVEVSIRNRKEVAAEVFVVERGFAVWEVLDASHGFTRLDAHTAEAPVTVGPDEEVTLTYTTRTTW